MRRACIGRVGASLVSAVCVFASACAGAGEAVRSDATATREAGVSGGDAEAEREAASREQSRFDEMMDEAMSSEGDELVVVEEGEFGRVGSADPIYTGSAEAKARRSQGKVRLVFGEPRFLGFCDGDSIQKVVRRRPSAIRRCFEEGSRANPKIPGEVVVRWMVSPDGSVEAASTISTTMNDGEVEGCVVRVIERMRFKEPDGGVCSVEHPFVFSAIE